MSRRSKQDSIGGQFVWLLTETTRSPAWLAMSHGARLLYLALKERYSTSFKNNGRVYLSTREAAKQLRSNRDSILRWFRELQHYGFIVMTNPGSLGVDGKGKAAHWRLTECPCNDEPPTKDYLHWNRVLFQDSKKQNPGPKTRATLAPKQGPPLAPKGGPLPPPSGPCIGAIRDPDPGPDSGAISRLTISSGFQKVKRPSDRVSRLQRAASRTSDQRCQIWSFVRGRRPDRVDMVSRG
jgi:hypothetical protein